MLQAQRKELLRFCKKAIILTLKAFHQVFQKRKPTECRNTSCKLALLKHMMVRAKCIRFFYHIGSDLAENRH